MTLDNMDLYITLGLFCCSSLLFDDGVDFVLLQDLHDGEVAIRWRDCLEVAVRGLSIPS